MDTYKFQNMILSIWTERYEQMEGAVLSGSILFANLSATLW